MPILQRMSSGALAFGLSHCLAAILFGLGRSLYANTQYGIPSPQPWGMLLIFGLLPSILTGGAGGYLIGRLRGSALAPRLAIAGGVAGGLAYICLSAAVWGQLGISFPINMNYIASFAQAAIFGLLTGISFGVALRTMRIAVIGGLSGLFGFEAGFLIQRILVIGLSLFSASTGYHFPAVSLQDPWYWLTWIVPYTLYGAIGGAILVVAITLPSQARLTASTFQNTPISRPQ